MTRQLVVLFAALEALFGVALGIGIVLVPFALVWGINGGFQANPLDVWRWAVDVWALGHAIPLTVTIPENTAVLFGEQADLTFIVSLAPLGFALFSALLGYRAGRRVAAEPDSLRVGFIVLGFVAIFTVLALMSGNSEAVALDAVAGTLRVVAIFAAGMALSWKPWQFVVLDDRLGARIPADVRELFPSVVRSAAMVLLALTTMASALVLFLLVQGFATEIALYEAVHGEIFGGLVLTVGQIMVVPTVVLWAVAWIVGPGFSLGVGTLVSPASVTMGAIPSIPLLGSIPWENPWGTSVVVVTPLIAFLVALRVSPILIETRGFFDSTGVRDYVRLVVFGLATGVAAALLVLVIAQGAGGAAGPGRFVSVGIDVAVVATTLGVQVAVGTILGSAVRVIRPVPRSGNDPRFGTMGSR